VWSFGQRQYATRKLPANTDVRARRAGEKELLKTPTARGKIPRIIKYCGMMSIKGVTIITKMMFYFLEALPFERT
jgi:hypothetical protein